jgi:hypothetical protein
LATARYRAGTSLKFDLRQLLNVELGDSPRHGGLRCEGSAGRAFLVVITVLMTTLKIKKKILDFIMKSLELIIFMAAAIAPCYSPWEDIFGKTTTKTLPIIFS